MRNAAIVALGVALLVAGCSGSDDGTSAGTSAERAQTTSTSIAATTTTAPVASFDPIWALQANATIVLTDADGAETFSPTGGVGAGDQNNPDWSPDGTRLTFTVGDGRDDLWVVDADGENAQVLADCTSPCIYYDDPAWSPDGQTIAACKLVEADGNAVASLVSVDVNSGAETALAGFDPTEFCAGPRFAPDGTALVLEVVARDGLPVSSAIIGATLTVLDLASSPPTELALTDPALFAATADWNRTGELIVYSALPAPDATSNDLFTIRPDGSDPQRLTTLSDDGGNAVQPSFDQSGSSVVFVDASARQLTRVDLANGSITPAFPSDVFGDHPRARPST
jgi:Tol biopolymer transport system component